MGFVCIYIAMGFKQYVRVKVLAQCDYRLVAGQGEVSSG